MKKEVLLFLCVFLLAATTRFIGLGTFMTADEENWVVRSGEWWHKLSQGDLGGTFITSHPGATLMWIAGSGVFLQESRVGEHVDTSNIILFRPMASRMVVLAIALLIGFASFFLLRAFGLWPAVLSSFLLVFDPYSVGMSQVVHLDMLLSLFMLNAFLAFLCSLQEKEFLSSKHITFSLFAGIFSGCALATKMLPSFWLFVMFGVIGFCQLVFYRRSFSSLVRQGGFIGGVAMLVFVLLWPALWIKPDVGDTLNRDTTSVVTDEHIAYEDADDVMSPLYFYIRTVAGRLLPLTQVGLLGGICMLLLSLKTRKYQHMMWMVLYAIGFLVLITFVAKKSDRYALPAITMSLVLTGYGIYLLWMWLQKKSSLFGVGRLGGGLIALIVGIVVYQTFSWSPYAIAYNNSLFPDVRFDTQEGWGEGLDAAARWLNDRPRAEDMYIASWYPSVTARYFKGKTFHLSSRNDYRVSYIVTYRNMMGRAGDDEASNVLDEVKGKKPVHVVYIHGIPYAWIYETLHVGNFTRHIGELTGSKTVGQLLPIEQPEFSSIDIGFATFSGRKNTEDVVLHVRDSVTSTTDLRTVRVNASDIIDNEWQTFTFDPIENATGKEFYVFIDSPTSVPGNAVTVRYADVDIRPGDMVYNGSKKPGDIAYKLPD